MRPRSKSEGWYYTWIWELDYICHTRQFRKWVKRNLSKARRRYEKTARTVPPDAEDGR